MPAMPKKKVWKIFVFAFLLVAVFASAFCYQLIAAGSNIFSGGQGRPTSMVKQLSDLIINPSAQVKGEETGQVNILLLGIGGEGHAGGSLTDTIMIASLKPGSHEAALLSIPRDLYVEVEGTGIKSKINAVKALGDQRAPGSGIELLEQTVEKVSGLPINYYVQLDFAGFTAAVDTVGGLDVYLENDINDATYPDSGRGYDPFYIQKGQHHLDGATALKVARSRHSAMGDFDRIKRQQEIIKAFRSKVYEKYSSADILALSNVFLSLSGNMKTDIEPKDLPRFFEIVQGIKNHNFTSSTVDTATYLQKVNVGLGYTLGTKSGDYAAIQELGQNLFQLQIPANQQSAISAENALIAIENGTGSPDLANTIAGDLEAMGFRIISSTNVATPDFSGVVIRYPADSTKPATLAFLSEKFSAQPQITATAPSRADFTIVLGKGF